MRKEICRHVQVGDWVGVWVHALMWVTLLGANYWRRSCRRKTPLKPVCYGWQSQHYLNQDFQFLFEWWAKVLSKMGKNSKVWTLKEIPLENCNSEYIVEHFHLHKKVPVLMNHNKQFFQMSWFISTGTFLWRWKCSTIQSCSFTKGFLSKSIL